MKHLLKEIKKNNRGIRFLAFVFGLFLAAFAFNVFFAPNNIVVGGVSGIAIIVKEMFGISTTLFINVTNIILITASFIFLGKKGAMPQLASGIMFPCMITLTAPLYQLIPSYIESQFLLVIIGTIIYGVGCGLAYRAGFSTGGMDIVVQILSTTFKKSITHFNIIIQPIIIIVGAIVFSPVQVLYGIFVTYVSSKISHTILFGVSTSKMVYVISKRNKDIEDYIMNKIHTGATEIKVKSGFFEKKKQMIYCIVHNAQYSKFKEKIMKMDPDAFILANNCYEVNGGIKYSILPF